MKKKLRQLVKEYLVSGRPVKPLTQVLPPAEIRKVAKMLSPTQWRTLEENKRKRSEYHARKTQQVLEPSVPDGSPVSTQA